MIQRIEINPRDLKYFFDYKTTEMCKSCKRYNTKQTCPPNVSSLEYYKNLLPVYECGAIFYDTFKCSDKSKWKEIGTESSLIIHTSLLKEREVLFNLGHYYINCFGAGSCKLCKECSVPCRQPDKAIIPLEATGINVVKLMKSYGVDINFPITDSLYRIGVILYD